MISIGMRMELSNMTYYISDNLQVIRQIERLKKAILRQYDKLGVETPPYLLKLYNTLTYSERSATKAIQNYNESITNRFNEILTKE